jgi:hypothetical protein
VKELRDNDAFFVRDVDTRERNAVEECVLGPDLAVEDAVAADYLGVDVGEEPERDVLFLAELGEDLLVIVRDRIRLDPLRQELVVGVAQLAELRPARGSPDGGSVEDHDRLRATPALVIVDAPPVCVWQREVRQSLADLGAGRVAIG